MCPTVKIFRLPALVSLYIQKWQNTSHVRDHLLHFLNKCFCQTCNRTYRMLDRPPAVWGDVVIYFVSASLKEKKQLFETAAAAPQTVGYPVIGQATEGFNLSALKHIDKYWSFLMNLWLLLNLQTASIPPSADTTTDCLSDYQKTFQARPHSGLMVLWSRLDPPPSA